MRQWMVNPKFMCRKHLLGEHVEHHMFVGTLQQKKNIKGYIENNLLEPLSLKIRHDELVKEMEARGYNHYSPLEIELRKLLDYLPVEYIFYRINRQDSEKELFSRCEECKRRRQ